MKLNQLPEMSHVNSSSIGIYFSLPIKNIGMNGRMRVFDYYFFPMSYKI